MEQSLELVPLVIFQNFVVPSGSMAFITTVQASYGYPLIFSYQQDPLGAAFNSKLIYFI